MGESTMPAADDSEKPGSAEPTEPASPGRSRRTLWIALSLVLVLLIAGGSYLAYALHLRDEALARQTAFETAESHSSKALKALKTAQQGLSIADVAQGDPLQAAYQRLSTSALKELETADSELAAAEKATALVEDAAARTALTSGIKHMRDASKELDGAANVLPEYGPLIDLAREVSALSESIFDVREDTLLAINKSTWSAAAKKNKSGLAQVGSALKKLDQMEKLRLKLGATPNGILPAKQEMQANKSLMGMQSQLISNGRAGRISTYNSFTGKYNSSLDSLDSISVPGFYNDSRAYLGAPMTAVTSAASSLNRAEEKLTEARKAFLASK